MSRTTSIALDTPSQIRRRALAIAAAALASAGLAGTAAADADALTITSDGNGLQMTEPGFQSNRVKLSLVDAGGIKYRVETPNFGGDAITVGAGCVDQSTVGTALAICDRIAPKVSKVSLGPGVSTFKADPSFPDPITVTDQNSGPDFYTLGAGNDTAVGGTRDDFAGGAGNDSLTSSGGKLDGGDGNDALHALNVADFTGRLSEMTGGAGNDTLTSDRRALVRMNGGEGTDAFNAGGAQGFIDSRDGIAEQVVCGKLAPGQQPLRLINGGGRVFRKVTVDLVDTPGDADMISGGCTSIDRAPKGEKTAARLESTSLKLRRGRVGVKVRCSTSSRCTGKVSVTVKGQTRSRSYSIRGRRTAAVSVAARTGTAAVRIAEKGKKGPRTVRAAVSVKR